MSKQHLRDIVKLDDDTFSQWKAEIKKVLIKEGEWDHCLCPQQEASHPSKIDHCNRIGIR